MNYLHWDEQTITDFSEKSIAEMYGRGYVFTRIGKGVMQQTRSVRIDLATFELSSENRRILKKTEGIAISEKRLPFADYSYGLGMDAKYFYDKKFGPGIMSAQKVKEMLTDPSKSNFNLLLVYSKGGMELGYAIAYASAEIFHYSYPFYHMDTSPADMGLGMMIRAIVCAKEAGARYICLGSLQRPGDAYKLQFQGLEWFDGQKWLTDIDRAKESLRK